jgi:hypothetical protein
MTFDFPLFLILIAVCVPGILSAIPGVLRTIERTERSAPPGKLRPSPAVVIAVTSIQTLLLVAIASAVGVLTSPASDLEAPFFEGLVSGDLEWFLIGPQLAPAAIGGALGALIFLSVYYFYYRPRLDAETVRSMETLRLETGFWGRILYGGIVEEVLTRWGLMTLFVWIGSRFVIEPTTAMYWGAIIASGLLFGLGHLPSYRAAGCRITPMFWSLMILLNLWVSLIFGYLYWQFGLLSAMLAHMIFHLVWYPFDRRFAVSEAVGAKVAE